MKQFPILTATMLIASTFQSAGIPGQSIAVQGSNVVVSWPSEEAQRYAVRYRSSLSPETPWVILADGAWGQPGTNRTSFVHSNIVKFAAPPQSANRLDSAFGRGLVASAESPQPDESPDFQPFPLPNDAIEFLTKRRVFPPYVWDRERRAPRLCELEHRPPFPWEAPSRVSSQASFDQAVTAAVSASETDMGFYRVDPAAGAGLAVTNGQVLSGTVLLPISAFGFSTGAVVYVGLMIDGQTIDHVSDEHGVTNHSFQVDTTWFQNGARTLQLGYADNTGTDEENTGGISELTPPILVVFHNSIFAYDLPGIVERRFVGRFGTTVENGLVHARIVDDQGAVWMDETNDIATIRQSDGSLLFHDPNDNYYGAVTNLNVNLTITPTGEAAQNFGADVSQNFLFSIFQRNPEDFGQGMSVVANLQTSLERWGRWSDEQQNFLQLIADNYLYAFETIIPTVDLDSYPYPPYAFLAQPTAAPPRTHMTRLLSTLRNNPAYNDYPLNVTCLFYIGHGWLHSLGWADRNPPYNSNFLAAEFITPASGAPNKSGVLNFAGVAACYSAAPSGSIMRQLVGSQSGRRAMGYYKANGLWPKTGLGCPKGGKLRRAGLGEPYTPSFEFMNNFVAEVFDVDAQGWPKNTFAGAFTRAAAKNADSAEGSLQFALAGCTNCYLDEVITGRIRSPTPLTMATSQLNSMVDAKTPVKIETVPAGVPAGQIPAENR